VSNYDAGNKDAKERLPPRDVHYRQSRNIGEQSEGQPLQDLHVSGVLKKYLRADTEKSEPDHVNL
jgi:hypothetical protein